MQEKRTKQKGDGLLANFRFRRKWKRLTSVLSVFVVAGTISALMLPAVTMNGAGCGLAEHVHGAACYQTGIEKETNCDYGSLGVHQHTAACCGPENQLICGQGDFVVHKHDGACYNPDGRLACALEEIEEHEHDDTCYQTTQTVTDEGHTHGDACYEWVSSETPTCGVEVSTGHRHEDSCYATGTELVCKETESSGHAHSPECYGEDSSVVCDLEESTGHTHETGCYMEAGTLLCTNPESDGHQHTEECFDLVRGELTCAEEEREPVIEQGEPELMCGEMEVILHTHMEDCFTYDADGNVTGLICQEPEVLEHQHTDVCFTEQEVHTLICTIPEHSHTDDCRESAGLTEEYCELEAHVHEDTCRNEEGDLVCALQEHQHSEACLASPLTGEEQAAVDALDALIEGMPAAEEVQAQVAAFDEEDDMEGLNAYMEALLLQVQEAKRVYDEMTGMQKASLRNREKLDGLIAMFSLDAMTLAVTQETYGGDRSLLKNVCGSLDGDKNTVSGQGITFRIFDYSTKINELLSSLGINGGSTSSENNFFAFKGEGGDAYTANLKFDNDPFYKTHSTVKYNLQGGYPVLDLTQHGTNTDFASNPAAIAADGTSLRVLFGGCSDETYVRNYTSNVNTPLQKDSNGWYWYRSADNAADFNTENQTWYVRNYKERNETTAGHPGYYDFHPFNYSGGSIKGTNAIDASYQFASDGTADGTEVDYWYGTSMDVTFYQPKNGKVQTGEDMVFEFSGDDDVWVFVDDVLVLDLGGTHGQVSGSINFATGYVEAYLDWDGVNAKTGVDSMNRFYTTTIYENFKAALKEAGKSDAQIQAKLDSIFEPTGETIQVTDGNGNPKTDGYGNTQWPVYRFKNYTTHSMKYFYLERGSAVANCNIRFNLPTLPKESLTVGKDITFVDDQGKPDTEVSVEAETFAKHNLTYTFRVLDQTTDLPVIKNATVFLVDDMGNSTGEMVTVDSNGYFTLKADQRVRFDNMLAYTNTAYYVEESIPTNYTFQYGDISYGDGGLMEGLVNNETRFTTYRTKEMYPDQSNIVVYTNQVISEHMSFLVLKKETLPGSDLKPEDRFPFKVSLGGVPVEQGTEFVDTENRNILLKADSNGVIYLASGQSVMLNNPIIAGTSFRVEELDKEGWQVDRMEGTYKSNGEKDYADGDTIHITGAIADGEIPVNTTATVTAYNKTYSFGTEIPLSKQFQGVNAQLSDFSRFATFSIEQVKDAAGTPLDEETLRVPSVIPDVTLECLGQNVTTGGITIGYLSTAEKKDYYYRIVEISSSADPKENFINDASVYVFQITVTEGAANITAVYKDGVRIDANSTAAFVNTLAIVELPATGGAGTILYTFSGWAIILTACALMYNNKRKQRKGAR